MESPLLTEEALFEPFLEGLRKGRSLIGLEAEKFGIYSDGSPLRYGDSHGIPALFAELSKRFGWSPESETDGGPPLALLRDGTSITLEPGSQFELSGSPFEEVHSIAKEVETHKQELAALESARSLHWLGLGFHPLARQEDLDWVPKSRYPVMRRYLPTRGARGLDMMRRTCTVQANFDLGSEALAMRRLRVALAMSPLVQALFANSPLREGKRTTAKSQRAEVWLDVDPDRTGLLPFAWKDGAVLGDYVRWALRVPMFILKRDGAALDNAGQTFEDFFRNGFQGHRATRGDWETHLNTLFPEVRLKRTLEVRSADAVPSRFSMALPALWAGVLYDEQALATVESLLVPFGHDAWLAVRTQLVTKGLAAQIAGNSLQSLLQKVMAAAEDGLARRGFKNADGQDERVYLEPMKPLLERGQCVGDALFEGWDENAPNAVAELLQRAKY